MNLVTALRLTDSPVKPCVALIGAGGKSSLLFRIGNELAASGRRTLLTTTTRVWMEQAERAPVAVYDSSEASLASQLPTALHRYQQVLALAGPDAEDGKVRGLSIETVCRLAGLEETQAVVVEADGSRERPLKAPSGHEPAVPPCATHVVTVAGLAMLGQPLTADWVHRTDRAARLMGLSSGDTITPDAVARLLLSAEGGLKGHSPGVSSSLYINLQENESRSLLEDAHRIASRVLRGGASAGHRYDAVLIGSAQAMDPVVEVHSRVAGVILAAGRGSRMAGDVPKQVLSWGDNDTLIGHAVQTALLSRTLDEVLVVTGYQAGAVAAALAGRPVRIIDNASWHDGQASSVRAAMEALAPQTSAAVFLLADQPAVTADLIDTLVVAHRQGLAPIVAPVYQGGRRGNPVLFDRSVFGRLSALTGDAGGRVLFEEYGARVQTVFIDRPQPEGIETREDYIREMHATDS